jgi:polyhydroxybutyrate depolymerase
MKKTCFILCIFFAFIAQSQTLIVDSIYTGGIYRNYRLYIPAIFTGASARPLIINMHGYTSNAIQQQFYTNFEPIADTANFLMVYPNGTFTGGSQFWNAGISSVGVNDISFLSNLIDSLKAQYNIDLNRVYSTGMSNGGFMSHTLACELSNRIAAIASVTGSIFVSQYGTNCHPTRPVPVMQIHGTADATVPYIGNSTMAPIDSVVKYWVRKNNCNVVPTTSALPNINVTDGCTADHFVYASGTSGSTVEHYRINGGAHTWPGAPISIGVTNQDFSASKEIWRFFRPFKLNALTSAIEVDKQNLNFSLFPNPANNQLQFKFDGYNQQLLSIEIVDICGKMVISEHHHSNNIQVGHLNSGLYFMTISVNGKQLANQKFIKE